jgi:hypothetical protein
MLFPKRSMYVGLVLFKEGLDLIFPLFGIIFLVVSDTTSGIGSDVQFNLQKYG